MVSIFRRYFLENMAPEITGTTWLFRDYYSYTIGSIKMRDSTSAIFDSDC
jgi:hypothetical protein